MFDELNYILLHLFTAVPQLPIDLEFAWRTVIGKGASVVDFRARALQRLRELEQACRALDELAIALMDLQIFDVAKGTRPALMAALIHAMGWPDWSLPDCFVEGFKITGIIPASNLFRRVPSQAGLQEADLLGPEADTWNEAIANDRRPNLTDSIIFDSTELERSKGYIEGYYTKKDMDKKVW